MQVPAGKGIIIRYNSIRKLLVPRGRVELEIGSCDHVAMRYDCLRPSDHTDTARLFQRI